MESSFGGSHRGAREGTPDVLPASQFLQEKLQERRARSTRPKRARQSDFGPRRSGRDDDIFLNVAEDSRHVSARQFDGSPLAPGSRRGSEMGGSSTKRRMYGAKDLDDHMDRLTKESFALKLELDIRREHTKKLQVQIEGIRAQAERAEQLQEEHAELLRINTQLVEELEKRDKAVEEAMDIICDLEDKVADLEERSGVTRPSTANADSGYAGTETHEQVPPSSPPEAFKVSKMSHVAQRQPQPGASAATSRLFNAVNGQTPARPRREPSVLSQKKPSTHALRSVYLETSQSLHPVKSFQSLLSKRETEDDEETLNSPRLSVLSESSFPSIYSPKKNVGPDRYAWEAEDDEPPASPQGPSSHLRQDSIKRVSQWMDGRDEPEEMPSKSTRISSPLKQQVKPDLPPSPSKRPGDDARYRSIADALSNGSTVVGQSSNEMLQSVSYIKPFQLRTDTHLENRPVGPTSLAGPIFGEPLLPPTPDSASTRMLRASRSSIAEERSLLDTTPAAVKGHDILEPGTRTAPKQMRPSVELNGAYRSYLKHRDGSAAVEQDKLSSDEDGDGDDVDAHSETFRDLSLDYDGFPDGNSILMGTPSRFLTHPRPPASYLLFDGTDVLPAEAARSPLQRRQSSSGTTVSPRKPSITRAETSPAIPRTVTCGMQSSAGSVTSSRSYHSGSSSNRTVVQTNERNPAISPDSSRAETLLTGNVGSPPRSRISDSPARTFSQRTQRLFRRMSNSHKDTNSEREKSPLPTLTSTPSSAYVNNVPREARRPSTSQSGDATAQNAARPAGSSRESRRPSMQARMKTAPDISVRAASATPQQNNTTPTQEGSGVRPGLTRRRGSLRDAVGSATRRAWR